MNATPGMAYDSADARFRLLVDDDGRGELEVHDSRGTMAQVVLPARLVRVVLVLFFARIEADVSPRDAVTLPSWRVGRPTLLHFAAKLALLGDKDKPMPVDGAATYLRLVNQRVRAAVHAAWPGSPAPKLVEQRQGGGLAAPLEVPAFGTDAPGPVLSKLAATYAKTLADQSLVDAFHQRLKEHLR